MIEIILKNYLQEKMGVPVVLELVPDLPEKFVLIERVGGGEQGLLCTPMFAVQSYGPTLQTAAELNERVKTAMYGLAELEQICRVRINTDYNFTDPVTKKYRYQAVFEITHYREG